MLGVKMFKSDYNYRKLFTEIIDRYSNTGVAIYQSFEAPVANKQVKLYEKNYCLTLPRAFRDFYTKFSDGCILKFEKLDYKGYCGIDTLEETFESKERWDDDLNEFREDNLSNLSIYDPVYNELVEKLYQKAKNWLPLLEYQPCNDATQFIDCLSGQIYLLPKEWYVMFCDRPKTTEIVLADNFYEYIQLWDQRYFIDWDSTVYDHILKAIMTDLDGQGDDYKKTIDFFVNDPDNSPLKDIVKYSTLSFNEAINKLIECSNFDDYINRAGYTVKVEENFRIPINITDMSVFPKGNIRFNINDDEVHCTFFINKEVIMNNAAKSYFDKKFFEYKRLLEVI